MNKSAVAEPHRRPYSVSRAEGRLLPRRLPVTFFLDVFPRRPYDFAVSDLSLPRTPVPARLLLPQGVSRRGQIYVMERVPQHDGPETVLELLNRPEGFFAFRHVDL